MLDVLARQRGDHRAAVRLQRDDAFARERAEGLPQRRARDAELLTEHTLVQVGARGEHAFDDQPAQPLGDRLVQDPAIGC